MEFGRPVIGFDIDSTPGVVGVAGLIKVLVDDARNLLLASYASPCRGVLHRCVPIAERLLPASNDQVFTQEPMA